MKKSVILIALLVIIAISAGFFTPKIVLDIQDSKLESQISKYDTVGSKIVLSDPPGIMDKLMLMSDETSVVSVGEGKNMDRSDAEKRAHSFLKFIGIDEFTSSKNSTMETMDVFVKTSRNNAAVSAIIWKYSIETEGNSITIYFDDETGQLLGFACKYLYFKETNDNTSSTVTDPAKSFAYDICHNCAGLMMDYYGFLNYSIKELYYGFDQYVQNKFIKYEIEFGNKKEDINIKLPLTVSSVENGYSFSFNC